MVEQKATKKTKKKARTKNKERQERRFVPRQTHGSGLAAAVGMGGSVVLGAGVYGQWIEDPSVGYAKYLLTIGAVVLGGALWFWDAGAVPVRVGYAGVALERKGEIARMPWCDIERITQQGNALILEGAEETFRIPMPAHPEAVAWILAEAVSRVPAALDVKQSAIDGLPKPKPSDGEQVAVEMLQVAGRHCAESKKPISFERDARLCPTCAQVYHRDSVPKACVTCGDKISGRVVEV